jgi:glycosyltransferase involved in cell wall biosynthesis
MSKKKLVHLSAFYHPHIGGVEKHLLGLNSELIKRNYEITVITQQHDSSGKKEQKINGVMVYAIPVSQKKHLSIFDKTKYKLQIWLGIFRQFSIIKQADIIHIHDVFFWIIPFLPFISRKKLFITFHGYEGSQTPNLKQIFWHRLANLLTNKNICIGGFHPKWYGIKPDVISFGAVQKLIKIKSQLSQYKLIYLGRLHEDTGIMNYLHAFKNLQGKNSKFQLDVYGDGPLLKDAQKYVKSHKLNVKFFGFVKNADQLFGKYQIAYVSRYLTILESLSSGVAVIAHYNNQIKKDYLNLSPFSKWIKIVNTPEEIVQSTLKPLSVIPNAIKWAQSQTWKNLADKYESIWQKSH